MVSNFGKKSKFPPAYVSNYGRIRTKKKKTYTPLPSASGYSHFKGFGILRKVSILVAAAFELKPKSRDEVTVEHKVHGHDQRANNALSNLDLLSQAEQNRRKFSLNPNRKSSASQLEKPILYRKVGEKDWVRIKSKAEAARTLKLSAGNIGMVANGTYKATCGYEFKWVVINDLPGEEWKPVVIDKKESGAYVSNMARFRDTQGVTKTPVASEGGRSSVRIHGTSFQFAIVVWTSFNGVSLSAQEGRYGLGDGFEVDHEDGNPLNDMLSNLRRIDKSGNILSSWSDPSSRRDGTASQTTPVYARIAGSENEWKMYESSRACDRAFGFCAGHTAQLMDKYYVKDGTRKKKLCSDGKAYEFSSTATGEKAEEAPDLPGEEWSELKEEFFQPFYFKRLAEAMFPSEGAESASDGEEEEEEEEEEE